MLYALMGMVLLALRRVPASQGLAVGLALYFLPVQLSLALSYICILARLVAAFPNLALFSRLKNYGRMSMTSYIGQTVLGILFFYPFIAWGYFGTLPLQQVYYITLIMLAIQLLFSHVWFRFFNFGPIEWLWRCATYRKWFPIVVRGS